MATLKGYSEIADVEHNRNSNRHTVVICDNTASFKEIDNLTWFMVKTRDRAAKSSNVYYFPNLPYTEEFIAGLFAMQEKEPAP